MKIIKIAAWILSVELIASIAAHPLLGFTREATGTILFSDDFEGDTGGFAQNFAYWRKPPETKVIENVDFTLRGHNGISTSPQPPAVEGDVIFADDFESYATIPGARGWGNQAPENYDNDTFIWFCGEETAVDANLSIYFDKKGAAANVAQITNDSRIGEGNALKITGQPYLNAYTIAKKSNLNTEEIDGRQLIFSVCFQAPNALAIGEGFGIWVMEDTGANNLFHISDNIGIIDGTGSLKNELLYVGNRKKGANAPVKIYAFGEEVTAVDADTVYDYRVTLTPDDKGNYTASITYNGVVKQLAGVNVPSAAELKKFNRLHVSPTLHEWRVWDFGYGQNSGAVPASAKDSAGRYPVGRTIGLLDDLLLYGQESSGIPKPTVFNTVTVADGTGGGTYAAGDTVQITANAKAGYTFQSWKVTKGDLELDDPNASTTSFIMPEESVTVEAQYTDNSVVPPPTVEGNVEYFSDDFERYTQFDGLSGWNNNQPEQYDSDQFRYFYADIVAPSDESEDLPYFGKNLGDPAQVSQIQTGTGVGSGKALEITGQPRISHYTMPKRSNVTPENSLGKQIVFETTFRAPNPLTIGEGFGVWLVSDHDQTTIQYMSDDTAIVRGSGDILKSEFLYVGCRAKAPAPVKIFAFGEEVAAVEHNMTYHYKVTLTPTDDGRYTAIVTINGEPRALTGLNLPTQEMLAAYNRVHVSPITHEWLMWELGFERSVKNIPANVKGPDGLYEIGRTLGFLDDLKMSGCDVFELQKIEGLNSSGEIALTTSAVTLKMTGGIQTFNPKKITISNGAVVTASVDTEDAAKLILTFENLKASTPYTITISDLLNDIGAAYHGEITLNTSNGVDVFPVKLNGSEEGTINRLGSNTVTFRIQKHELATLSETPAALVFVSKVVNGAFKNVKTYYTDISLTAAENSTEITGISVGQDEIIRVFVWNDATQMKPITNVTVFT